MCAPRPFPYKVKVGQCALLLLPPLGEGWDGGPHDSSKGSALAPTLTLPQLGKELRNRLPQRGRELSERKLLR